MLIASLLGCTATPVVEEEEPAYEGDAASFLDELVREICLIRDRCEFETSDSGWSLESCGEQVHEEVDVLATKCSFDAVEALECLEALDRFECDDELMVPTSCAKTFSCPEGVEMPSFR